MHVVKFIIGFIGGAVGFAISSAIFYLCIIRPIIVIGSGQIFPETVESVLYTQVIAVHPRYCCCLHWRKLDPKNLEVGPEGRCDYSTSPRCSSISVTFGNNILILVFQKSG